MARKRLGEHEIRKGMAGLEGWLLTDNGLSISRRFTFRDFSEAFAFMTRSALAAEKLDHHPDWSNSYKHVDVRLSTHDAGGLTNLDFDLAMQMNRYAGRQHDSP